MLLTGMTVRMPQTAYVVNNGLTLGSGAPQLTVHHRPPQVHAVSSPLEITSSVLLKGMEFSPSPLGWKAKRDTGE